MELNDVLLTDSEWLALEMDDTLLTEDGNSMRRTMGRAQVRKILKWLVDLGSIRLGDTDYVNLTWDELVSIEKEMAQP